MLLVGVAVYFLPAPTSPQNPMSGKAAVGKDYYVLASVIELSELDPEGNAWDSYNGTGPDIYYEIYWKDKRIFESTKKADTFVARWTSAGIDLRDMAIGDSTASLDGVIQAARLNIREGEKIQIRVYDSDVLKSDLAGQFEFVTSELQVGDTSYDYQTPGVRRLVIRVIDMQEPIDVSK